MTLVISINLVELLIHGGLTAQQLITTLAEKFDDDVLEPLLVYSPEAEVNETIEVPLALAQGIAEVLDEPLEDICVLIDEVPDGLYAREFAI